jgi:hypothetical protein
MDPLGALQAAIAVAIYPGGAFLAGVAALLGGAAGLRGARISVAGAAGVLSATVGAALAPLPGSLVSTLPPPPAFGPPTNLVAAIVLEASAVALVTAAPWTARRVVAAAAPLIPLLLLSAAAATLSLPVLANLPGAMIIAARALMAGSALAGAAALLLPGTAQTAARVIVLASITILAWALALEPAIVGLPAPVAAIVVAGSSALYGLAMGLVRRLPAAQTGLTVFAAMQGAAAVATILVARG